MSFVLTYAPSHGELPKPIEPEHELQLTTDFWTDWSSKVTSENRSTLPGRLHRSGARSLITLKALTYAPTGGMVAAPTTSLPERLGGKRNWDYRFCWLRDATFTLLALMNAGYDEEAGAWREWLLRAAAGSPDQVQIMYGIRGERHLLEWEVDWLAGYESSKPVRDGQRRFEPAPARCLRRGRRCSAARRTRRLAVTQERFRFARLPHRAPGENLAGARPRYLGSSQRTQAVHLFQGDGVGGIRSRHQVRRAMRAATGTSSAGANYATPYIARSAREALTPSSTASPRPTARSAWMLRCC